MKSILLSAASLLLCLTASAAETTRYVALVNGGKDKAGHQWVTRDGNRYKVDFIFKDNGRGPGTAGIRIRGEPSGLVFEDNVIRDTRPGTQRTQTVGIQVEDRVGPVQLGANRIEAGTAFDDRRREAPPSVLPTAPGP